MNYSRIYNDLMASRMRIKDIRVKQRMDGVYYERHHIIMKSKGGSNSKDNIVLLTAREHFIAHWMLWRIYRDRKTALSFHKMLSKNNLRQKEERYYSSKGYQEARMAFSVTNKGNDYGKRENQRVPHRMTRKDQRDNHSKIMKGMWSGCKNPFYGKKHSAKSRNTIRLKSLSQYEEGRLPNRSKLVLNMDTGIFYENVRTAWESTSKIKGYSHLRSCLNGSRRNSTQFITA